MSTEELKAIIRRFFEAFESNDQRALTSLLSPDLVAYLPGGPEPVDRNGFLEIVSRWNAAFSDLHFTHEQQIAEADTVANRMTLRGIHDRGPFIGIPPTGKAVAIELITTERVEGSQIVERHVVFDVLNLMEQLGAAAPSVPGGS